MNNQAQEFAELRRLAEAATPGPWEAVDEWVRAEPVSKHEWPNLIASATMNRNAEPYDHTRLQQLANAAFIAATNPKRILSLLDALEPSMSSPLRQIIDQNLARAGDWMGRSVEEKKAHRSLTGVTPEDQDLDEMCNCGHTAQYHSGGYGDCHTPSGCDCRAFDNDFDNPINQWRGAGNDASQTTSHRCPPSPVMLTDEEYTAKATKFLAEAAKMDNAPAVWMVAAAFKSEYEARIAEAERSSLLSQLEAKEGYKLFVWQWRNRFVAMAHALTVAEARQAIWDEDGTLDESVPIRKEMHQMVREQMPVIFRGATAYAVLTDSAELEESDNYRETQKKTIDSLQSRLAAIAGIEKLVDDAFLDMRCEHGQPACGSNKIARELQQRRAAAEGGKEKH